MKQSGWLYSLEIAPDFWDTLCSSPGTSRWILSYETAFDECDYMDLTQCTILQSVNPIPAVERVMQLLIPARQARLFSSLTSLVIKNPAYKLQYGGWHLFHRYPASYPTSTSSHSQVSRPSKAESLSSCYFLHSASRWYLTIRSSVAELLQP